MALSADEQRLLDQLEASLRAEDPKLVRQFEVKQEQPPRPRRPRPWWMAGLSLALGVLLLAAGMLWAWPFLSVGGFLVMFAGIVFVVLSRSRPTPGQAADTSDERDESDDKAWPY